MPRKKGSKNKIVPTTANIDAVVQKIRKEIAADHVYKATLKSLGRIYKSEGATIEDALRGIKISGGAKVASALLIEHGDVKKDKVISAITTHQLFGQGSPSMREYHLNKIKERFI